MRAGVHVRDRTRAGRGTSNSLIRSASHDKQPDGVQSVDLRNHSRWLLGSYPHLEATGLGTVGSYSRIGMRAGMHAIERERGVAQVTV
jgi:hypothetical protein